MEIPKWRVRDSTYVVDSKFLRLRRDSIELPGGEIIDDYFVREGRGFSVIFALTPERRVVLVRQYKYGINRIVVELPAGFVDEGEEPHQTAVRELAEETGYVADSVEHVRSFAAEPSNSETCMHVFLARDARPKARQQLDLTEVIEVELVDVARLKALVRDGSIDVMGQVAAIYFVLDTIAGIA